ncbi:zeta toxin family protein [Pannus brasiliensis CCIBt3594]|uniref:UDP-N-acetylglucosamine kinase n=1 Tax=Pannus brasiliensis CCIBt3594 TaxID=1427578 RepID=A0AAW9QZH8_9CHRO
MIGGANGAGKTTVALTLLPNFLDTFEYVNADEIARGLSPLNPESMAIVAGILMLERLQTLSNSGVNFAFETTLASRFFAVFARDCQTRGYTVNLIYFWLNSPELAIERVRQRVIAGGYNIPEDTIRRRYQRGVNNFYQLYLPICNTWIVYDNSSSRSRLIAARNTEGETAIYVPEIWNRIRNDSNS